VGWMDKMYKVCFGGSGDRGARSQVLLARFVVKVAATVA
jgi:hypothetical protein